MAAYSRRSSNGPIARSLSPSGRFCYSYSDPRSASSSSAFASSSAASFSARSSNFFHRSASPTRVNLYNHQTSAASSSSVRFALDQRSSSPNRSITSTRKPQEALTNLQSKPQRRTCMCSPTTHPGSFRCSLHKGFGNSPQPYSSPNNRLNARRSAMTNSLVRIGGVEGELVRRALTALIRPSSHQQRRRAAFQPRPSRLSAMSKAEDN